MSFTIDTGRRGGFVREFGFDAKCDRGPPPTLRRPIVVTWETDSHVRMAALASAIVEPAWTKECLAV